MEARVASGVVVGVLGSRVGAATPGKAVRTEMMAGLSGVQATRAEGLLKVINDPFNSDLRLVLPFCPTAPLQLLMLLVSYDKLLLLQHCIVHLENRKTTPRKTLPSTGALGVGETCHGPWQRAKRKQASRMAKQGR